MGMGARHHYAQNYDIVLKKPVPYPLGRVSKLSGIMYCTASSTGAFFPISSHTVWDFPFFMIACDSSIFLSASSGVGSTHAQFTNMTFLWRQCCSPFNFRSATQFRAVLGDKVVEKLRSSVVLHESQVLDDYNDEEQKLGKGPTPEANRDSKRKACIICSRDFRELQLIFCEDAVIGIEIGCFDCA